ncbi:MAG: M15 family metallopeptidase [Treponema sp.]|nr:M15 family metallopeptidase [Treponema sp.]
MYVQLNSDYTKLKSQCVPSIVKFVEGLDNGTADGVDFDGLKGFKQNDGSIFRVLYGWRSALEQIEIYKKGRIVKHKVEITSPLAKKPYKGRKYIKLSESVLNSKWIASKAWAGQSLHNWGCACDIVFRTIGDTFKKAVNYKGKKYDNFLSLYTDCGLLAWAKKCGLEWGGTWSSFPDVAHFEDNSYKIPPESMHYAENMCKDFIMEYNANILDYTLKDKSKEVAKSMKIKPVLFSCICAIFGYFVIKNKLISLGGKK